MGGTKERTTVGLQVERLVDEPEKAYKAEMRQAYKNVGGGMKSVMRTYQRNIIDSRSMFNDGYLTALGYNPSETINHRVVDPALVLNWCKANISSSVSSVSNYRWDVPTLEEIAIEYLQDIYGSINFVEKSFNIGTTKWFVTGTVVTGVNSSDATLLKNKETTVNAYALSIGATVVNIADGLVTDNGVNCWSAVLSTGPKLVPAVYMTVACPGIGSDVTSSVLAIYNDREYNMYVNEEEGTTRWSNTIIISTYITDKGTVGLTGRYRNPYIPNDWNSRIYTEATKVALQNKLEEVQKEIDLLLLDSLDRLVVNYTLNGSVRIKIAEIDKNIVSSAANAKAFPVIPIKENYSLLKDNTQLKAMLNKLGMATSDFEDSLADDRLKNAAILFIVDINDSSAEGTKVVYETLINMVKTAVPAVGKVAATESYQLNLGFSDINMHTTLHMDISTFEGVVAPVGNYVRYSRSYSYRWFDREVNRYITVTVTKTGIRKQVTAEYYEEMEFDDQSQTKWNIGGYELSEKVYIPITDIGLKTLTYEESTYVTALSMNIVLTSVVTTKTKWYQNGFFKFILIVALVALTVITFGTAAEFTVPAMAAVLGTTAATATTIFTVIVILTTTIAVLDIMGVDTGVLGDVATVLGLGTATIGAYGNMATMTMQQTVLTGAKTLVNLASMAIDINTKGIIRSIEDKMEMLTKEMEDSEANLKEITNNLQQGLWMGIQDRTPDMLYAMSSTALMCNYDILFDYNGMYEGKINSIGI